MDIGEFSKEHTFELSLAGFVSGTAVFALSVAAIWFDSSQIGGWFYDLVGDWDMWLFLVGIIVAIAGGGFLTAFYFNRKEFQKLMATESKKTFQDNLEDLEYVAWKLGTRYEELVRAKKDELGVGARRSKRR